MLTGEVAVSVPAAMVDLHEAGIAFDALLEERQQARADKDWARADQIRDELTASGIEIVDTPAGARWRRK